MFPTRFYFSCLVFMYFYVSIYRGCDMTVCWFSVKYLVEFRPFPAKDCLRSFGRLNPVFRQIPPFCRDIKKKSFYKHARARTHTIQNSFITRENFTTSHSCRKYLTVSSLHLITLFLISKHFTITLIRFSYFLFFPIFVPHILL